MKKPATMLSTVRGTALAMLFMLFAAPAFAQQTANVQIIHNSPYAAAAVVDVYVNDALTLDDFAFQDATGFVQLPAGDTAEMAPDVKIDISR